MIPTKIYDPGLFTEASLELSHSDNSATTGTLVFEHIAFGFIGNHLHVTNSFEDDFIMERADHLHSQIKSAIQKLLDGNPGTDWHDWLVGQTPTDTYRHALRTHPEHPPSSQKD